jgi:DNA modification methylase
MGTGTTAIVSKLMKRRYIGSEISKDYYSLCNNKLEQSISLFD